MRYRIKRLQAQAETYESLARTLQADIERLQSEMEAERARWESKQREAGHVH